MGVNKDSQRNVIFIHDDAAPLFAESRGKRFGGAEVQVFLLAKELAKSKRLHVIFVTTHEMPKEVNGVTFLKISPDECTVDGIAARLVDFGVKMGTAAIVQQIPSEETVIAAELSGKLDGLFIYQVSSDWEVKDPCKMRDVRAKYLEGVYGSNVIVTQHDVQLKSLREHSDHLAMTIPNGIRFPRQRPSRSGEYVLWSGRCAPVKRPWHYLELARDFPEEKFLMMLMPVFNYRELYRAVTSVAKRISNLEIFETSFADSQSYYDDAKLLISTSEYEGFPNTFLQAAKGSTPTLSFKVDPGSIFGDSGSYKFAGGSRAKMEEQLRLLLVNREPLSSMGKDAFYYAKERYDISKTAKMYEDLIFDLHKEN